MSSESSYPAAEEEGPPTRAVIVPESLGEEFTRSLNELLEDKDGNNGGGDGGDEGPDKALTVDGTACRFTGRRPHRDHHCGDIVGG
jgi:hypothetical protein